MSLDWANLDEWTFKGAAFESLGNSANRHWRDAAELRGSATTQLASLSPQRRHHKLPEILFDTMSFISTRSYTLRAPLLRCAMPTTSHSTTQNSHSAWQSSGAVKQSTWSSSPQLQRWLDESPRNDPFFASTWFMTARGGLAKGSLRTLAENIFGALESSSSEDEKPIGKR
jgi:hypothetical protein